ncbi:nucleotide exchange factor GrpE [Patescibacteria group bacterium]|nr:MAG: nucleotide exchange factor GrpE [Patescibacteria group bacterium]
MDNKDTKKDDIVPEETTEGTEPEVVVDDMVDTDDEGNEKGAQAKLKDLREKLKKAEAEKLQAMTGLAHAKADFINMRKQDEMRNQEFVKFAKEGLINEIIPALDSFDMAFGNKDAWEKVDKNWRVGVEYIYSQLLNVLGEHNLKQLSPVGEKFDPAVHEAVEFVPVTDEKNDHIITEVIAKGYSLSGKVIKAPKVKVGEYKKDDSK